jgi:hypothetical protein
MRELPVPLLVVPLVACMQIGTGTGTGTGSGTTGAGGGAAPLAAGVPAGDGGPVGTNCVRDPATQTVLCEQIDTCPGVDVDPGGFPDCGFRLYAGGSLDLECLCGSALCPVGVPTTCDEAKKLLDGQSALLVCQQLADGRCVDSVTPDAGVSRCDPVCRSECAGDPTCFQLCGC